MRTVHVVWRNWYDDIEIVAVYATDDAAQALVATMKKRTRWIYHVEAVPFHDAPDTPPRATPVSRAETHDA